jgi:hypothetical protein
MKNLLITHSSFHLNKILRKIQFFHQSALKSLKFLKKQSEYEDD